MGLQQLGQDCNKQLTPSERETCLWYGSWIDSAASSLLIACVGCVLTVGLAEFVYYQAGCLEHWCFRLEVLVEEGSELAAILLFLTFQSQELVALENPPLLA